MQRQHNSVPTCQRKKRPTQAEVTGDFMENGLKKSIVLLTELVEEEFGIEWPFAWFFHVQKEEKHGCRQRLWTGECDGQRALKHKEHKLQILNNNKYCGLYMVIKEIKSKMYQVGLDGGADPQFVPFLLNFLDEVNEHVCLKQVLQDKKKKEVLLLMPSFFLLMTRGNLFIKSFCIIQ